MDSIFEKNFIPTKKAAELSGYTSDYLARLARSGKISARRVGHTWFVDAESLTRFLGQQGDRKVDYARSLARAREEEYRTHNSVASNITKTLTKKIQVPEELISTVSSVGSHALSLSLALAVVVSGALFARAEAIPFIANRVAEIAEETAFGFNETFGNIPAHVVARIEKSSDEIRSRSAAYSTGGTFSFTDTASPRIADFISSLRMAVAEDSHEPRFVFSKQAISFSATPITFENLKMSARSAYGFLISSSRIAHSYKTIGENIYGAIGASFSGYRSLIENSGIKTLALAVSARDAIATAPRIVSNINLAFGNALIGAAHFAIRADTLVAYGLAEMAPKSAEVTVAFIGEIGDTVASVTSRAPALATTLFLRTTEAPSHIAPAIASSVFNAEYAVSARFVKDTQVIANGYLHALNATGRAYYESSLALQNLGEVGPVAMKDAYLAVLGKSALALESFARVPKVAAVLSATRSATAPLKTAFVTGLAAVEPAFTISEQIALATYRTARGIFDSVNRALAILLGPPPTIVLPSGAPRTRVITLTATTSQQTASNKQSTSNSYTTIVNGVSENFVNQSLASLRSDILATTAGLVRPVYTQTVTNAGTIQMVNKIEDLSNLIVRNGDFRGSIFDSGIRVTAIDGSFTNLSGGATALATTTITGDLTVSGTITPSIISASDYIKAPYFIATSTTATSTFAGSFAIDTNGFVYATSTKNVGIGVLSPSALLAVQNSTSTQPIFVASNAAGTEVYRITNAGFVGIGTTTPGATLAVEGSSLLGNSATAGYFTATTSTATSTFAGVLAIGTTTPYGNGLFTVGTSTPLLYIERNTGRIGIGTTTPASIFDIYGTDALRLPVGTSVQRPSLAGIGQVRFNTTTHQFEGYGDNSVWQGLGGVIDADQDTYITADTNNADEDTLRFFTFGLQRMTITNAGRIGIGTTTPETSAVLDITSTTSGMLPPRLTTTQKNAISSPAAGLTLYDSTLNKLNVYNGSAWKNVGSTEIGGEVTNGVAGSVLFIGDGAVLGQDNANFNYSTSTGKLVFGSASTSQLSVFNNAYFGATATSTFSSTGSLTLPSVALLTAPYASTTMLTAVTASTTNLIASASVTFQNLIGMLSSNGTSGTSARTLTGTANQITITNGDGTAGNPTFSLPSTLSFTNATSTNFFAGRLTANTFSAGQTASTTIDASGNLATAGTLSVTGQTTLATSLSGLLAGNSGVVYSTATSSLAIGASLSNSGTLGSQIGGTASSLSLNMANANSWTALQSFLNASSTLFSNTGTAYFGGTATSSFNSAGALTLASALAVTSGGTGQTSFTADQIHYGNFATVATTTFTPSAEFTIGGTIGALIGGANSTLTLATNGVALTKLAQIAANSILGNTTGATGNVTAIATSSLGIALSDTTGTLAVNRGGTGQTSFGQGWLSSNGTTISASTSPTVNYITATSTTATSTFAMGINLSGGCFAIGGNCVGNIGGTNGQIQFNNNGVFGGASLVWDTTNSELRPGTDNTIRIGTSTLRFKEGNFGPSGVNVWNVGGASYEQGSLAFSSNVLKLSTAAPLAGNYRDIQIAPGTASGLYLNTSGQVGLGYTSLDTSIGNALLVNGRVGIGTTTPSNALAIVANGRGTGDLRYALQIANSDSANTQATNIGFFGQGGSGATNKWIIGTDINHDNSNNFFIATSSGPNASKAFVVNGEGTITLADTVAPATPTNKLYSLGGNIYWNSVALNGSVVNYLTRSGANTYLSTLTDNMGVGTTSPFAKFAIHAQNGETNKMLFAIASSTANATSTLFSISNTGNLTVAGTATSTFAGFIDVNGTGANATSTIASNLWVKGTLQVGTGSIFLTSNGIQSTDGSISLTSGSATSTFANGLQASVLNITSTTATSTFARGIDLAGGCFAVNGTCVGGSTVTGTQGQLAYFSGTNIAVGTSTLFISTAGNVGVGSTTPSAKLSVHANSGETNTKLFEVASSTATATTTHFVVNNNGTVGVGTTTPAGTLGVAGTIFAQSTTTASNFAASALGAVAAPAYTFANDTNTGLWSPTADTLAWSTGGTERMRINSSGNLGIGTTDPSATLNVSGTTLLSTTAGINENGILIKQLSDINSGTPFEVQVKSPAITLGNDLAVSNLSSSEGGHASTKIDNTTFVVVADMNNDLNGAVCKSIGIAGTAFACGNSVVIKNTGTTFAHQKVDVATLVGTNTVVVAYVASANNDPAVIACTVSGTTLTCGSETLIQSTSDGGDLSITALDSSNFIVAYQDSADTNDGTAIIGSVSGTTVTMDDNEDDFDTGAVTDVGVAALSSTSIVIAYNDSANTDGEVVANTNITLGACPATCELGAFGTTQTFNSSSGNTDYTSITALSATGFAIAYKDTGSNGYATAIAGTLSGSTITLGAETVFDNSNGTAGNNFTSISALDASTVVVGFNDTDNGYGTNTQSKVIIGTISGTEINFGTKALVASYTPPNYINVVSLSSSKFFIGTTNNTQPQGKIGTIARTTNLVRALSIAGTGVSTFGASGISGVVSNFTNSSGTCSINPLTTALVCSSDIRLKKNLSQLSPALAGINALNPVTYNWLTESDDSPTHTGFIAQEVQPIFSDLVSADERGYLSMNYAGLTPYLVSAVQELNARTQPDALGRSLLGITLPEASSTDATTTPPFDFVGTIIDKIVGRLANLSGGDSATSSASMTDAVTSLLTRAASTTPIDTSLFATKDELTSESLSLLALFANATSSLAALLASSTVSGADIDLSLYAKLSDLASTTVPDLSNYLTISGGNDLVAGLVSTSTLGSYALRSDLGNYALRSDLNPFVSTSTFATSLADYAKLSDLPDFASFVSTSTLGLYSLRSDLGNYALRSDLDALVSTTTLASAISNIPSASLTGTMTGDITPDTDNTYALGSPTNRLSNVYATNINAGDLTFTETTSAISGDTLAVGDMVSLYVSSIAGSTHTIPINLKTAINSNSWGSNNIFFNTTGGFGIGIASTTALRAKLDVEGAIASGDARYLTLANTSGANGNAAIPYSFTIPSTTGDLNISSNDNNGALVNSSYSAWNVKLGGQSDSFAIQRSPTGTLNYSNLFSITSAGKVGVGTTSPSQALSVQGNGLFSGNLSVANLTATGTLTTANLSSTGLLSLANASTSLLSVFNNAYFGGTATSSFNSAGVLTLASALAVTSGGTGQTSFGQGWLSSNGTTLSASTSPTVNYITATSTTATSTFAAGLQSTYLNITGTVSTSTFARGIDLAGGCFSVNGTCLSSGDSLPIGTAGQTLSYVGTTLTATSSLFVATSGNIGIGTTTPGAKLSVHANNGETNTKLFEVASSTATATTTHFVVNNNGTVGVGTTTPAGTLGVAGTIFAQSTTTASNFAASALGAVAAPAYTFANDTNTGLWSPTADTLAWSTGGTERMRLNSSGYLGIGNSTPATTLGVTGNVNISQGTQASNPVVAINTPGQPISFSGNAALPSAPSSNTNTSVTSLTKLDSTHVAAVQASNGYDGYGTLSVISVIVGTYVGTSIGWGTPFNLDTTPTSNPSSYHGQVSISAMGTGGKFVVAWRTASSGTVVKTKVCTVSGTVPTCGATNTAWATQNNTTADLSVTGLDASNFILTWDDDTTANGKVVVGQAAATTISYGSASNFYAGAHISYPIVKALSSTKFVISFVGSSTGQSIIGDVSGTTITLGSAVTFNNASTAWISSDPIAGSSSFLVAFQDTNNSSAGSAMVGTYSGNVITFGNKYYFSTANAKYVAVSSLDASTFALSYQDGNNGSDGTSVIGSISGSTVLSFGTATVYDTTTTYSPYVSNVALTSTTFLNNYAPAANDNGGAYAQHSKIGTISTDTSLVKALYIANTGVSTFGASGISGVVSNFTNSSGTCSINPLTTALVCSSDIRLKKNLSQLSPALAGIDALNPVTYNWLTESDDSPTHTGFIAQEVQPIFSDLVSADERGYLSMNYAGLTPYLVSAVQELNARTQTDALGRSLLGITLPEASSTDATSTPPFDFVGTIIDKIVGRLANLSGGDSATSSASMTDAVTSLLTRAASTTPIDTSLFATKDELTSESLSLLALFANATSSLAALLASSTVSGADIDLSLYAKLSDLASTTVPDLSNYLTISGGNDLVAGLVSTSTLSNALSDYAKLSDLPDFASFVSTSTLDSYALMSDLGNYALLSGLDAFVSTSTFATSLADYAKLSDLPDFASFVSTSTLSNYATLSALNELASSTSYKLQSTSLLGTMTGDIIPDTDNTYALGSPENRLSNVYAMNINAGDLTFTETTSAISGDTLAVGDMVSLYVSSIAGSTHTIPINFKTAINSNAWGSNNIFFNTTGGFGIGVASTTALRAKLDVEGAIASGDARYLTLANTSGANGNAAIPYSFTIPSTSGDLNISSNDNNGALVNSSYSAWNVKLGGQSDTFSIQRSPTGTLNYSNFFNITNAGKVGIGTTSPSQALSVQGNGLFSGNLSVANLTATSSITAASLALTTALPVTSGGTGVSTFTSGQLLYGNGTAALSSVATTTPTIGLGLSYSGTLGAFVGGASGSLTIATSSLYTGTTGQLAYFSGTNVLTATSSLFIATSGNIGIGTTTPGTLLSLGNTGANTINISATATSTFGSGLNLLTGCFAVGGVCVGGSTVTGTTGQLAYFSGTNIAVGTSTLFISTAGNVGIGTTTPQWPLSVYSASGPQLSLSAGAGIAQWAFRNAGGNLYFATTTVAGTATTSTSALTIIGSSGNVGIGTTSPGYALDVAGSSAFGTGSEAMRIDSTGNVGIGTTTPYSLLSLVNNTASLVDIFAIATSTSGIVFKVDSYGRTYGDGAYSTPAADYAEYFKTKSAGLQSGEVVCVDMVENNSVKRCERGADNNVMGIVSTKPSVIGNYTKAAEADPAHHVIVGMMGQVDTFVSAENGAINVGDSLTSASSTPGYAMRADGGDSTVGIALEPLPSGTGKIKVLISRRNKSLAVEEVETLVVERIANMKIEDSVQQMVKQAVDKVMQTNLAVSGNIFAGSYETALLPATSFTPGSTVSTTSTSSVQAMFTAEIPSVVLTADGNGVDLYKLATYNLSGVQALAEKFAEHDVRLTALETRVTALESGAVSSESGTPSFSTTSLASALESLGAFISKGVAQFGTLIADRFVAATNSVGTSSAGTVTILAGNTVAQVDNAYVLPSSKIFVTLTASTTGSWYVSDKQEGSFRLVLSEPQATDVSFDYFIVQTEGQVATSSPMTANIQQTTNNANDTTPPVITLLGDNPVYVSVGTDYIEQGITLVDDTDPAPTYVTFIDGIQMEINSSTVNTSSQTTHIITYSASDSRGNSATATRSVIVGSTSVPPADGATGQASTTPTSTTSTPADTTPPVVTLTGDAAMQVNVGDAFTDPGATATDDTDGVLTAVVTGTVDTTTAGLYTLTYTATDSAGNIGSVSRVVTVIAAPSDAAATSTPQQ